MRVIQQLILSTIVALLLVSPAGAEESSLWETDLDAARQQAATSGRMVLIHFWAPWCGPCMQLDRAVLSKPTVLADLRKHVVPVKLNVDQNEATARKYGVKSLPCDVVIYPQGELIKLVSSPRSAAAYVTQISTIATEGKEALAARFSPAGEGVAAPGTASKPVTGQVADSLEKPLVPATSVETATAAPPYNGRVASNRAGGVAIATDSDDPASVVEASSELEPANVAAADPATLADMYDRPAVESPPTASPMRNVSLPNYDQPPAIAATTPATAVQAALPSAATTPPAGVRPAPTSQAPLTQQLPAGSPPLGLEGFCPVHLAEGKKWLRGDTRYGAIHRGRTYLFGSDACQKKFLANPDHYSPVLQGNDVIVALEDGQSVPGRREFGVFYGDHVYLFANEVNRDRFERDHQRFADAATKLVK